MDTTFFSQVQNSPLINFLSQKIEEERRKYIEVKLSNPFPFSSHESYAPSATKQIATDKQLWCS